MKFIGSLILLLATTLCFANGVQITATGGAPIPIAYSASNTQSQMQFLCSGNLVEILNQSSTVLGFGFGSSSSTPVTDYAFVPPGPNSGNRFRIPGGLSNVYVYIRSAGSAITSTTVQVSCFYEG